RVVMYADGVTDSMRRAVSETNRRRRIQEKYNKEHGVTPTSIVKKVREIIRATAAPEEKKKRVLEKDPESMSKEELAASLKKLEKDMRQAASELQFERAALFRDEILELKKHMF
ncbi:MAG: UvrB/UvrC motif-containing protein, partial [Firmicutes bacterium]|nr:UvrB/UvrC motif-containing protein [Bacillota bacterium]